ncbi:MAG TPA: aminoglycoside phosphotransferase family protein [Thermomicrobiaceae bacterium]|nr:aminoglycoside phosphotransferase family protein [Thermomicrobiaceae bacterium]
MSLRDVIRLAEGVSTRVYRLRFDTMTLYLRVLPEPDATFAPEALVHDLLRRRDIPVPEVIYDEDRNELLQRSIMVTAEIPGAPLTRSGPGGFSQSILQEAGRCLAVINSIPVDGYGWIRRDLSAAQPAGLEAELPDYQLFVDREIDDHLDTLGQHLLDQAEIMKLERVAHKYRDGVDPNPAVLAHGDFDASHIFQDGGHFSGVIDFGEIRGTDPWYDLGHFRLHDGEQLPQGLFPWLLAGYRLVRPEQSRDEERIIFASLLIATRSLARAIARDSTDSAYLRFLLGSLKRDLQLLDG